MGLICKGHMTFNSSANQGTFQNVILTCVHVSNDIIWHNYSLLYLYTVKRRGRKPPRCLSRKIYYMSRILLICLVSTMQGIACGLNIHRSSRNQGQNLYPLLTYTGKCMPPERQAGWRKVWKTLLYSLKLGWMLINQCHCSRCVKRKKQNGNNPVLLNGSWTDEDAVGENNGNDHSAYKPVRLLWGKRAVL